MDILSMVIAYSMYLNPVRFGDVLKNYDMPTVIAKVETPKVVKKTMVKKTTKLSYNCVLYARSKTDVDIPYGLYTKTAKKKAVNTDTPKIGAPVVTNEGRVGHLAIVRDIQDNKILVEEANYVSGHITTRWIALNDKKIVGYITN